MFDPENNSREGRERSLLSLNRASRDEAPPAKPKSSLRSASGEDDDFDAAMRHRLARSRREAVPNPLLSALAGKRGEHRHEPAEPRPAAETAASKVRWSISDLIPGRSAHHRDRSELEDAHREWPGFDRAAAAASGGMHRHGQDDFSRESSTPLDVEENRQAQGSASNSPSGSVDDPELYWRPLIDPMQVVMGIANSKKLILATTILGALLGVAIALSTPKKFEGVAELLIDPRDIKIVDRDLTQSGLPSDATMAIVENQVRVLTSGIVLNKVVDKLNLTADPEFNGEAESGLGNPIAILRSLFSSADSAGGEGRRRALTIGNLAESLSVERGGKTFVVLIIAKTLNPEKSALIANTLTDVFMQTYGEIQSDTAGRATTELTSRLAQLQTDVEAAERKVEAYKNENDIADAGGRLIGDDEMIKLNEQLTIARARTLELNAKSASARDINVDSVLGGTLPEEISSNTMTELRSQYASLKQEADRLAVRLGPRHPQLLAIQAQLGGAREQIQGELRRIISSNQVELKRAVQLEQELAARLAQIKVRQGGVSEDLVSLRELEREAAAKRAVYESFLLRARETGEQRDLNTANMSVISRAYPPLEAVGPSRSTISFVGMMLGLMVGVGIGGARGAWRSLADGANGSGQGPSPRPRGPGGPDRGGRSSRPSRPSPDQGSSLRHGAGPQTQRGGWMPLSSAGADWYGDAPEMEAEPVAPYANRNLASAKRTAPPASLRQAARRGADAASAAADYEPRDFSARAPHVAPAVQPQPVHAPQPPVYQHWSPAPPPMAYGYAPMPQHHSVPMMMQQPVPMMMPQPWPYMAYPQQPQTFVQPMPVPQPRAEPPASAAGAVRDIQPPMAKAPIDEVRESLREFREAVLDVTQNRVRRRHS